MIITKRSKQNLGLMSSDKLAQLARYIEKNAVSGKQTFIFDYLVRQENLSWYVVSQIVYAADMLTMVAPAEFDDEPMTLELRVKANSRTNAAFICRLLQNHTPIQG
ncbi:hypothetical protein KDA11_01170 [Candidatus Saccharibacteria bacterium]|nr:hypothetical protein [Candidatus Saccharibacteria bacterium]